MLFEEYLEDGEEIIPNYFHSTKRVNAVHSRPLKGKGSRSYPKWLQMLMGHSASFMSDGDRFNTLKQLYHSVN